MPSTQGMLNELAKMISTFPCGAEFCCRLIGLREWYAPSKSKNGMLWVVTEKPYLNSS